MSSAKPYGRSIFSGLLLISLGGLFLLYNFRGGFNIWRLFWRWWPVLLILWGLAKLYDHFAARRAGQSAPATISGGDILLVLFVIGLAGTLGVYDRVRGYSERGDIDWPFAGHQYSFSEQLPPRTVTANMHISINTDRGDIVVRAEESSEMRVVVKKSATAWSEEEAKKRAQQVAIVIQEMAGGYEVLPKVDSDNQMGVRIDLEVYVPRQVSIRAKTEHGDIQIPGVTGAVTVNGQRGNIEIRDAGGEVSIEVKRGDVHVLGAQGNVKISGRGREVEIADVKGEATLEGEFLGPIHFEKVAKGARFVSRRTDLTVSQHVGRIETGSGRLEISDALGNVSLVTRKYDVLLEKIGGRVNVENRQGNVELHFVQPPREEVEVTNQSGSIELVLPAKSSFELSAESRAGDIDSEFDELEKHKVESQGNSRLEAQRGGKGPQIRLKTSYGTIRLRKGES